MLHYDYIVDIDENPEAFHPALHHRHCSFSQSTSIITISKNHFYVGTSDTFNEAWTTESHNLNINSPSCLQLSNENILVMDTDDPDDLYVFQVDTFKILKLNLPEHLEPGSKLTLIDGQVHVLGGSKVVKKLVIEDNEIVSISNVSKSLRDERSNFVSIEVPLSFFF